MLKRGIEVLVGVALVTIVLAVLPGIAEAQEGAASTQNASDASVVVEPGDSLWSISSERLGPDAAPQRIANDVERIYALNRGRIGPDPNLVFPGEELSLPAGGSPAAKRSADASTPTARETNGPAQGTLGTRAARGETKQATETAAVGEANGRAEKAHDPASERQVNLPKVPAAPAVPAAASALDEYRATADERRPLGWGIIALTLLVGAMMVRTLPMRRTFGTHEVWGIPPYSRGRYAYPGSLQLWGDTPGPARLVPYAEPGGDDPEAAASANEDGVRRVGLGGVERWRRGRILRERAREPRRHPRNGLATGAYGHNIRRTLLRVEPGTRRRLPTNVRAKARRQRGGR
jgi:LysM repeat protein